VSGLNDFTHGATAHHFMQGLGCGVAFAVVHASAHIGVQAQKVVAHQHLAILQRGRVAGDQFEVAGHSLTHRAVVKVDLWVQGHRGLS
jgi:hypothetical protein